jgi:hypothetical protein
MNARRSHSADRILDVIKDYKLSPMPFIPYASTLSLSVAYRKWRFSRLPMFRTRGGADFKKVLPVVQELGAIWSSARINGQLGQAVMLKLDRNEILNRKRVKKTAEAARAKRSRTGVVNEGNSQEAPTKELGQAGSLDDTQLASANPAAAQTNRTTTPPGAPSSPRIPPEPTQATQVPAADNNTGPPSTFRAPLPSPTTSSFTERPQQQALPLTWTTAWTADNNTNSNNLPIAQSWPIPPKDNNPTPQQPEILPGYEYSHLQPDDAIPLPGDLLAQPAAAAAGFNAADTSPLAGLSEGSSLEDFLVDDDALFRSWDPRFAQSVDFSFSSILDPGNPFAWPEYGGLTS